MNVISQSLSYIILSLFGIGMVLITYMFGRWGNWESKEGFLVAERNVNWLWGGFSIAASWIWAPALFVSVQVAYQMGLAGVFWFTMPNVLSLAIFAFLAPKIRSKIPTGYTLPQYIREKLGSKRVHRLYLFPYLFYQLMAVVVQLYAGGNLVSLLTGLPLIPVMFFLAVIILSYTLISGLKASIVTDFLQLGMILAILLIIIPLIIKAVSGWHNIYLGINGINHTKGLFDTSVALSFGIVTSIGLLAGSITDQSNWQRAFAVKQKNIIKAFIFGSILFAIVPLALSVLGFIAANPNMDIHLQAGFDISMIGVQTISQLLPNWASVLFLLGLLAILSSAFDAGLCAASSLWSIDISKADTDQGKVKSARFAMVILTLVGLAVSILIIHIPNFGLQQLWWIFNIIAACTAIPTVLSLYYNKLSEKGVFWGILVSFVISVPLFVYSNITNNSSLIVGSSLLGVILSLIFSLIF